MKTAWLSSSAPDVRERLGPPLGEGPLPILGLRFLGGEALASVASGYFRIWVHLGAEGPLCPLWALSAGLFNPQHFTADLSLRCH